MERVEMRCEELVLQEQCVLRCFGHIERLEDRMVKRIVGSDVIGVRLRGRSQRGGRYDMSFE